MKQREFLLQLREMIERCHGDVFEIAHRLGMDPFTVQYWINFISDQLS